jgi:radical SAM superfamily enzyme YgiQ (UPF0313 family)
VVTGNTRYRKKSAEKVLNEIEHLVKKYNLTHLKIIDDNFFVDIQRVRSIGRGIIERNLKITWDAECRCDYFNERLINDETLKLLKESGLIQLTLGIESGSEHTLDLMKKHITPAQAEYAVRKCNEYRIIARSSFMIEVPGETIDDIKKTIRFVNRLRKYPFFSCGMNTFRPYPKCELSDRLIEEGYLKEPRSFEEWNDPKVMAIYTAGEIIRPWQVNGEYSVRACYYVNMESGSRLGQHQLETLGDKIKNRFFIAMAKLRNRLMLYAFPFDKELYQKFLTGYYEKQNKAAKGSGISQARESKESVNSK